MAEELCVIVGFLTIGAVWFFCQVLELFSILGYFIQCKYDSMWCLVMPYLVDVPERPPYTEGRQKSSEPKGEEKWWGLGRDRREGAEIGVGLQYVREKIKIKNLLHKYCGYIMPVTTSHSSPPTPPIHPAPKVLVSPLIKIITYMYTHTHIYIGACLSGTWIHILG